MRRFGRLAGTALAAGLVATCVTWTAAERDPRTVVKTSETPRIQVVTRGGEEFILQFPRVLGDSLVGTRSHQLVFTGPRTYHRHAIALADVETVRMEGIDALSTTFGVLAGGAAWWYLMFMIYSGT